MKTSVLFLLFLVPLLSGCFVGCQQNPSNGLAGVHFQSKFDGGSWNDDGYLHMRVWLPDNEYLSGFVIPPPGDEDESVSYAGGLFDCLKYEAEWADKPWWMEVAIYTTSDFDVEVDRVRFDEADCIDYSFEISPNGELTAYTGCFPDDPLNHRLKPWIQSTLLYGGLAIGVGGFGFAWFWAIRRMKSQ